MCSWAPLPVCLSLPPCLSVPFPHPPYLSASSPNSSSGGNVMWSEEVLHYLQWHWLHHSCAVLSSVNWQVRYVCDDTGSFETYAINPSNFHCCTCRYMYNAHMAGYVCDSVCGMSGASLLLALLRLLFHPNFIIFSGNAQLENKYQKSHVMHY